MFEQGLRRPHDRFAAQAGRLALCFAWLVVAVPVWLVWIAAGAIVILLRPLLLAPLALAALGGLGVCAWFASADAWADAAQAAVIAVVAGCLLLAVDRMAPGPFDRPTYPPWWWYC